MAMVEMARLPEQQWRGPLAIASLPEEILLEILLLLPLKSILQCRVPSARPGAPSPPSALSSLPTTTTSRPTASSRLSVMWAVAMTTWMSRTTVSKPLTSAPTSSGLWSGSLAKIMTAFKDSTFTIHASCDGLLLISYNNYLHLCNPTTRQWLWVFPPALQHDKVVGLYVHGHPFEYRVLYYREIGLGPTFYITTIGSGKERCIWPHSSSASLRKWLAKGTEGTEFNEPFLSHGNLHWLPHLGRQNKIVVFDTLDEVFRWLHVPFKIKHGASLLEIEGRLAMSNSYVGSSKVNLWLLQDYKCVVWVHKYHIQLPVIEIRCFEDVDGFCSHIVFQEGDVLVDGFDWQFHYDRKGNCLEKF